MSTYWLLCFYLSVLIIGIAGQESPCPNLFRYEYGGNQWFGVIRIPSSSFGSQIAMTVSMSLGAQLPTSYVGKIEVEGSDQEISQIIQRGGTVTYKLHFPLRSPVPKVTSIEINNRLYCSGPPEVFSNSAQYITTITLDHTLSTVAYGGSGNRRPVNPQNFPPSRPAYRPPVYEPTDYDLPVYQPPPTTTAKPQIYQPVYTIPPQVDNSIYTTTTPKPVYVRPTNPPPIPEFIESIDVQQCGKATAPLSTNALIKGGEATERGEWPWLGALFSIKSASTSFICSGSLISSTDIITAAHCVPRRKTEKLLAKFGLHNINEWGGNVKISNIQDSHIHPNYNRTTLHNDIAILKISRIEFTAFIQPICMWASSTNLNILVGKTGTVVGWGKDENGNSVTPEPKKATARVASTEECQRNDPRIIPFTSSTTMCAGNKDGTGPCSGDSGGGLYFLLGGKWHIRGIVSNSLPDKETDEECGLRDFVVYTDVSKYSDWINSIQGQ
ncbi:serine protease gd-like isoform X2 [Arctopsyche grandis]|uniref:serine protease gd-like isoform X2 n=1 Tax=Arctopsyche grandis TaxID=121162 RepID=UPI00406D9B98